MEEARRNGARPKARPSVSMTGSNDRRRSDLAVTALPDFGAGSPAPPWGDRGHRRDYEPYRESMRSNTLPSANRIETPSKAPNTSSSFEAARPTSRRTKDPFIHTSPCTSL